MERPLTVSVLIAFSVGGGRMAAETRSAAEWMDRGKADLTRSEFNAAEVDFRKAIALEPHSAIAYVLLTRALLGELPPNFMITPDDQGILPKAEEAAKKAVELAPSNVEVLCVAGTVDYQFAASSKDPAQEELRWGAARTKFNRALQIDPASVEAHYAMGRMLGDQLAAQFARHPGPLNPERRQDLRNRYGTSTEQALSQTQQALDVKPEFEPAVEQMAGLLMLRSVIRATSEESAADMRLAEVWRKKIEAIRAKQGIADPPRSQGAAFINGLPSAAPPPPPH